jgi:predicted O-methyltransferase YrrM
MNIYYIILLMSLNIGWRQWDKFLSKFVNKKTNILEIGSYKGDATCVILEHLATNPDTKVYAIDTWEGSPEYPDGQDFSKVENEFNNRIKNTGKEKQLIKMKMLSSKGLIILIEKKIMFDFIFIDASHEAKNVISDAILSWEILKPGGVIIFDDYEWDVLKQDHFRPKLAIDSFISIFKSELKVLFKRYQCGIEKLKKEEFEIPELSDYHELIRDINEYKSNFDEEINMKIKQKLLINVTTSNKPPEYVNNKNDKYINFIKKGINNEINDKYYSYELNRLLGYFKEFKLNNIFSEETKEKIKKYNFEPFDDIKELYLYMGKNMENAVYESIGTITNKKLIQKNKINFINFSFSEEHSNDLIKKFIIKKTNVTDVKCFDINTITNKNKENNIMHSKMNNINEMNKIIKFLNKKMDIIKMSLTSLKLKNMNRVDYEKYYCVQFFYEILFCLRTQDIGGTAIMLTFTYFTEISVQLLYLLKKYYNKLYFTNYKTSTMYITSTKIIASDFIGISSNEINDLYKVSDKLRQDKYDDYDKKYDYLISIMNTTNNKEYDEFKTKIIEINNKKNKFDCNNIYLWRRIKKHAENLNGNKLINFKNEIFKTQIKYAYNWINKYIN